MACNDEGLMSAPTAENSVVESEPPAPGGEEMARPAKRKSRLIKAVSYIFWNMAALTLPLVLNQFVACPILRKRLGRDAFGGLMWVRDCSMLFGNNLANGFSLPFLREMVKMPEAEARHRLRVAMTLTFVSTLVVMAIASVGCYFVAGPQVQANAWQLFVPFTGYALARAMEFVATVRLRVVRAVRAVFVLRLAEGLVLCLGALCIPTTSMLILAGVYLTSGVIPLVMSIWFNRDLFEPGKWWEAAAARDLVRQAPNGALMVLIDNCQLYAPGLLLGAMASESEVTLLKVASVGFSFLVPITNLGQTMLNYLAGEATFDFRGKVAKRYAQASLAVAVAVGLLSYFVGAAMIWFFYPADFVDVMKFYHWFALANSFASVRSLMRPLGVKFASLSTIVKLSAVTLAVQLISLVALIPTWKAAGSVMAMAIASGVGMFVWLWIFAQLKGKAADASGAAADASQLE